MTAPRKATTLAEVVEALRLHINSAEARDDLAWRGSLEKLRLRTEEQKALNDARRARERRK
jgi:hypothetical protein